jgi:nitrogen fixation/metabolism regulation signal transduction histidine kinase
LEHPAHRGDGLRVQRVLEYTVLTVVWIGLGLILPVGLVVSQRTTQVSDRRHHCRSASRLSARFAFTFAHAQS